MAIIFTNKSVTGNKWHMIIAAAAVVAMALIAIFMFYPRPPLPSGGKAPAALDFKTADSDFVKNLELFPVVSLQGIETGRTEPFLIYYQTPTQAPNPPAQQ